MYLPLGNESTANDFKRLADARQEAMELVFWNETEGLWLDWDLDSGGNLDGFYASSLVPLHWGCGQPNITRYQLILERLAKDQVVCCSTDFLPLTSSAE